MSDCFVLYLLLTCMKKKTSGADKFTNNNIATIKQENLQKYVPQMASVHSTGMIKTICRRKCFMAMVCGLRIHMMREAS